MTKPQTSFDLTRFRWIESQSGKEDREALLSCQEAICRVLPTYVYLEVGSHLGGSLQPHVIDGRCKRIFSIDPRPKEQPDERWLTNYKYEGNSTARMLELLSQIPNADIGKIQTFEASSWDLQPGSIPAPVDFAFIDGEHTNAAVLRDFGAVRRFLASSAILLFHDCDVTPSAFFRIASVLRKEGLPDRFLYYPRSAVLALTQGAQPLRQALLEFGWVEGLPYPRTQGLWNLAYKHFPRATARLARLRPTARRG